MANSKIVVSILKDLSLWLRDHKTLKMVKIRKSLFRYFLLGVHQIDHGKSENRSPETVGSILKALGLEAH